MGNGISVQRRRKRVREGKQSDLKVGLFSAVGNPGLLLLLLLLLVMWLMVVVWLVMGKLGLVWVDKIINKQQTIKKKIKNNK